MPRRKSSKKKEEIDEKNAVKEQAAKNEEKKKDVKMEKKEVKSQKKEEHVEKTEKKAKKAAKQPVNPTYAVIGIAAVVLVVGIVIGMSIGGTAKTTSTASFSKPVAYVITDPYCSFCNDALNKGIDLLKTQFNFSDKEFDVKRISFSDKEAQEIYKAIETANPQLAFIPSIVFEGNIQNTGFYKSLDSLAKKRGFDISRVIIPAGKYYVLAPAWVTHRYDPSKPETKVYIYTDQPVQLYRLAGAIMNTGDNIIVEFKQKDGDYLYKIEGPTSVISKIKQYFPNAEVTNTTITVPLIKAEIKAASKQVADQVAQFLQGAMQGVQATEDGQPDKNTYFVEVITNRPDVIGKIVPPEWNRDGNVFYVLKAKKPVVDLFVMSYCPYGLQAEKAIIPVIKLLGNKIDFHVRFVNYSMHYTRGEITENSRQYCIQEKDDNAYLNYLSCFTKTGNANACMKQADINAAEINACINALDKEYNITATLNNRASWGGMFPPYPVEDQMNKDYSVRGSPTLVIQHVPMGGAPRNPEALKELICAAFLNPPAECSTTLSSQNTSPGFGSSANASASAGSCG